MELTHDRLVRLLSYSTETGLFTWNEDRKRVKKGNVAGYAGYVGDTKYRKTYIKIKIDGRLHYAHRLAIMFCSGRKIPDGYQVDHINGIGTDNRISNLRLATHKQNCENKKAQSNSKSGIRGVSFYKTTRKWVAQIQNEGKVKNLGYFENQEDAVLAYESEAKMVFTHYI